MERNLWRLVCRASRCSLLKIRTMFIEHINQEMMDELFMRSFVSCTRGYGDGFLTLFTYTVVFSKTK